MILICLEFVFEGLFVVGAKSGERLRWLLGVKCLLAGWLCGGFCNVKWERSKTVYFDKTSVTNPNKQQTMHICVLCG